MREVRKPRVIKFSSLPWLVNFLNLQFDSKKTAQRKKVEAFLSESAPRDDISPALNAQSKFIGLIDLAIKASSPRGLVMELNDYVGNNSDSSPWRSYPPVRAHWYARPLKDLSFRDASQATLKMGSRKWVVHPAHLMHGTEGRVWLSVIQCLENGEFGRIRRCLLRTCQRFFITDDARRKFCNAKHQKLYDRQAAKARVQKFREAKVLGARPKRKSAEALAASPVTEAQRFSDFLKLARGNVIPGDELALFIKRKLPGDWKTVNKWFAEDRPADALWAGLPETVRTKFREFWKNR